jgi:putative multiple sugar transport system substrate-binding protein
MTACRVGIISSLKGVGYAPADMKCRSSPARTPKSVGQGDDQGEQYSTVFKDTRELAKVTAKMVDAVLPGKEPEINDTKTYNNGVKVVPSYLLTPVFGRQGRHQKHAGRLRLLQGRPDLK